MQHEEQHTQSFRLPSIPLTSKSLITLRLPILDKLVAKAARSSDFSSLDKTAIIYIHHPLYTSINLLNAILTLGVKPKNTFVLGKYYSQCSDVVNRIKHLGVHYQECSKQIGLGRFYHSFIRDVNWLWRKVISTIDNEVDSVLILDHGGHALAFTPDIILEKYKVIGIEKTTSGLTNPSTQGLPFPIIEMASCAAKRVLESPLIAEAIVTKLTSFLPIKSSQLICGVVGYGAIGRAVTEKLLSIGHKVIVHDNDFNQLKAAKGAIVTKELPVLIAFSDYIFGCTGNDIVTSIDCFRFCNKDKTLISCSSEDKEFLSLLHIVQQKQNSKLKINPLNDIEYQTEMGATIRILRGGFPVNFDHSGESVPGNIIQLTRCLAFGAVLQAARLFKKNFSNQNYMLDPTLQKFITNEWLMSLPHPLFPKHTMDRFQDEQWIADNSGGIYEPSGILL